MNIFSMPQVLRAFNPAHAVELLVSPYNKLGFMILGSVFLAATGAEALYSDMGHVGRESIYISWPLVKICLILNYLGQGAWLLSSRGDAALASLESLNPFFLMLPGALRPVAVILSALAAVIASQALITGSYTLVSEAIRLDLMPHLKVQYPAETKGQIYIDTVNKILWVGCTFIVLLFRSSAHGVGLWPCHHGDDADDNAASVRVSFFPVCEGRKRPRGACSLSSARSRRCFSSRACRNLRTAAMWRSLWRCCFCRL